jgi:hypothetical protein
MNWNVSVRLATVIEVAALVLTLAVGAGLLILANMLIQ